jgi:hypothetical protein
LVSSPDVEGDISVVNDTDIDDIHSELADSEVELESTESLDEALTAMVEAPPDTVGGAADDSSALDTRDGDQLTADRPSDADASSGPERDDSAELDLADPTAADDDEESAADAGPNDGSDPETDDEKSDAASDRDTSDGSESDT